MATAVLRPLCPAATASAASLRQYERCQHTFRNNKQHAAFMYLGVGVGQPDGNEHGVTRQQAGSHKVRNAGPLQVLQGCVDPKLQ